jgi:uncharacterized protein
MRKSILIVILFFATFQLSVAQNAIAKLKFQDAEEAYTNANYELTIKKLDDVEVLLKATNPKLLHLRILATNKLVQSSNYSEDPEIITQLKKDCNFYLTKYESIQDNEEKFREVYKISESAKKYKCDENLYNTSL